MTGKMPGRKFTLSWYYPVDLADFVIGVGKEGREGKTIGLEPVLHQVKFSVSLTRLVTLSPEISYLP